MKKNIFSILRICRVLGTTLGCEVDSWYFCPNINHQEILKKMNLTLSDFFDKPGIFCNFLDFW